MLTHSGTKTNKNLYPGCGVIDLSYFLFKILKIYCEKINPN